MLRNWERVYRRTPSVRLRRTAEGGAAFLPAQAATVELDDEAFAILCWLGLPLTARQLRRRFLGRFGRHANLAEIDRTVRQLDDLGFVAEPVPGVVRADEAVWLDPESIPIAPESVHLQLTNACNLRCPSCYVGVQATDEGSLSLERLLTLVDEIAELGVFQLALGGGEPLMSPHAVPVVQHARRRGLLSHVTTNGWLLTKSLVAQLREAIGEVRLSFNDGFSISQEFLAKKAALLQAEGVPFGVNVIVTHRNVRQVSELLRWFVSLRPATITLIRPKPSPHNRTWYDANALSAHDSWLLLRQLRRLEPLFTETDLTVDCAFSHLFGGLSEAELAARGVAGCSMGERFVVVASNGDVYPCSYLRREEFKAGNVIEQSFSRIWQTSPLLARLRARQEYSDGHCGPRAKRQISVGCRAIQVNAAQCASVP